MICGSIKGFYCGRFRGRNTIVLRHLLLFAILAVILLLYILKIYDGRFLTSNSRQGLIEIDNRRSTKNLSQSTNNISAINLAVVVCGDRWEETFVLFKSALLLTKSPINIFVFADVDLIKLFSERLREWQKVADKNFTYQVLPVTFPSGEFESDWRKLFKPCSSQRLFLSSLLKDVDAVLYVDTDTLFLGPLEQIWSHFARMNNSQFAALAPEHEDPLAGWYNRFARHPFYKPLGVNTGVMLMNLTRMRKFEWERYLLPIYKKYKLKIPWGDQDIINIIFHFHPDKLYIYPCNYNYRADHCMYSSVCKEAEKEGVIVLHGSRGIFHSDKYPSFRSVYTVLKEYTWGSNVYKDFYLKLENYLDSGDPSNCGKMRNALLLNLKRHVSVRD